MCHNLKGNMKNPTVGDRDKNEQEDTGGGYGGHPREGSVCGAPAQRSPFLMHLKMARSVGARS